MVKPIHSFTHLLEKFSADTKDVEWIRKLGQEGHWVVISGDSHREECPRETSLIRERIDGVLPHEGLDEHFPAPTTRKASAPSRRDSFARGTIAGGFGLLDFGQRQDRTGLLTMGG